MATRPGLFVLLFALGSPLSADEVMTPEQLDKWFNSDDEASAAQVSEGALQFISPPEKPVLHSINTLTIDENSIDNGWVGLAQCYRHLDAVPVAEVVYRYKQMRGLQITATHNIGSAQVKGQSVQLRDVLRDAELCIRAEVRIFYQNPDQTYSLVNGPFHRRFLDGYYPYHVTLNIHYPGQRLQLEKTRPAAQSGFEVKQAANSLVIDSHFEGALNTEIFFREK
jgi:hypothetical protein